MVSCLVVSAMGAGCDKGQVGDTGSATPTITVDATATTGTVDDRTSGVNIASWDPKLDGNERIGQLRAGAVGSLRYPGGSLADGYHWATNDREENFGHPPSATGAFADASEKAGTIPYITVNYGSGTAQEAAAWVAWANGSPDSQQAIGTDLRGTDWKTVGYWAGLRAQAPLSSDDGQNFLRMSHPAAYRWKYFEIGNEIHGNWEHDLHGDAPSHLPGRAHDAATYAAQAAEFIGRMKSVDASIHIGLDVLAEVGKNDDYCESPCDASSAVDSRSGGRHFGWTPVLLHTLAAAGVRPDFLIVHYYPQQPGYESDAGLLQRAISWPQIEALLRRQIADYGWSDGLANTELAATEVNSTASAPGKQTVGLVNALFYADNYGQMLGTRFTAAQWWLITGPEEADGNMSAGLYGTRRFGDYAWFSWGSNLPGAQVPPEGHPYPTFQVVRQLIPWREPGSIVLATASNLKLLAAYATRQSDGQLSLLVINKSPTDAIRARVKLSHFQPGKQSAFLSTYGISEEAQDREPTETSLPASKKEFDHEFPAYSSTLIRLHPA